MNRLLLAVPLRDKSTLLHLAMGLVSSCPIKKCACNSLCALCLCKEVDYCPCYRLGWQPVFYCRGARLCTHGHSPGPLPVLIQEAFRRMNETPLHKEHSHGSSALQASFPRLLPKPSGAGGRCKLCKKHTVRLTSDSKERCASPRGHFEEFVSNVTLARGSKGRAYGRTSCSISGALKDLLIWSN